MSRPVRVRFAPSPTGPLHIGGVRTALYNYLFAKKMGGTFILRIEDTDQTRFVPGAEEYIREALDWCGMAYEEGPDIGGPHAPYRQSERGTSYTTYGEQLIANGHAYYAFDTPEELDAMRERLRAQGNASPQYDAVTRQYMKNSLTLPEDEVKRRLENKDPYVVRLKMPRNEDVRFEDLIRGWVTFNTSKLDDKVLIKADGLPTYHLANVVDDHLMEISHVIRGEEWLPSAPLHVLLYEYLGWGDSRPAFAHLPLILRPDGKGKLSKRDGDKLGIPVFPLNWTDPVSGELSSGFREKGYDPGAFLNLLAFLGWNPGTEQEVFNLDELIQAFSIEQIGKSGARFDPAKAAWFNQQFLKAKSNEDLLNDLKPFLPDNHPREAYLLQMIGLLKERVHFVKDFIEEGRYLLQDEYDYDQKALKKRWKDDTSDIAQKLIVRLQDQPEWTADALDSALKNFMEDEGLGMGQVLPIWRLMLCGTLAGPPISEIAALLGKERCLVRMQKLLDIAPGVLAN